MGTGNQQRPSPAAIALVAAIALCAMSLPALGQGKNLGFGDRFKAPAVTYEVSKVSRDGDEQKKLLKIFNIVREANGGTLTKAEFVRRLKAREHFEIQYPDTCSTCNGWKRLIPRRGQRGADGKVTCRACRGSGIQMRPYVVKWKNGFPTHKGDRRDPVLSSMIRQLGDDATAQTWFSLARRYHTGNLKDVPHAREAAHAAYEQAVAKATVAWRDDEPSDSNLNHLHRRIIDESLIGISATAPQRVKRQPEPVPEKAPEKDEEAKPRPKSGFRLFDFD